MPKVAQLINNKPEYAPYVWLWGSLPTLAGKNVKMTLFLSCSPRLKALRK
jgi:hypothetical protein